MTDQAPPSSPGPSGPSSSGNASGTGSERGPSHGQGQRRGRSQQGQRQGRDQQGQNRGRGDNRQRQGSGGGGGGGGQQGGNQQNRQRQEQQRRPQENREPRETSIIPKDFKPPAEPPPPPELKGYLIVQIHLGQGRPRPEVLDLMSDEKKAFQRVADLESGRPFLSPIAYSTAELTGQGDYLVLVHDDRLRLAVAYEQEADARHFLKNVLPKMGLSRDWAFTLVGKASEEGPQEEADSGEAEPLPEENSEQVLPE